MNCADMRTWMEENFEWYEVPFEDCLEQGHADALGSSLRRRFGERDYYTPQQVWRALNDVSEHLDPARSPDGYYWASCGDGGYNLVECAPTLWWRVRERMFLEMYRMRRAIWRFLRWQRKARGSAKVKPSAG